MLTIVQACDSALGESEFYEHSKTEDWNTKIIVSTISLIFPQQQLITPQEPHPEIPHLRVITQGWKSFLQICCQQHHYPASRAYLFLEQAKTSAGLYHQNGRWRKDRRYIDRWKATCGTKRHAFCYRSILE